MTGHNIDTSSKYPTLDSERFADFQAAYNPGMTAKGSMNMEQLTDIIADLVDKKWASDSLDEGDGKPPRFTIDEPTNTDPTKLYLPTITFDVYERVRSASHRSIDPIFYGYCDDPNDERRKLKQYRTWFDVEVEFKIYHETNKEAAALMEEFEIFLFEYKPYLKERGLSELIFLAELPPTVETRWQRVIPVRTLRYLVRIERVITLRSNKLATISTPRMDGKADINHDDSPLMTNYRDQMRIEE